MLPTRLFEVMAIWGYAVPLLYGMRRVQCRRCGIGCMPPHSVHRGLAPDIRIIRQATLDAAFLAHPNRFKNRRPRLSPMPAGAWINPPPAEKTAQRTRRPHTKLPPPGVARRCGSPNRWAKPACSAPSSGPWPCPM